MTLIFDKQGLLVPDAPIKSTLAEFVTKFVTETASEKRQMLFGKYVEYSNQLKSLTGLPYLEQWINGSYVTGEMNPHDMDLVTFLDHQVVQTHYEELQKFIYPFSEEIFNVDAYIVEWHPEESSKYPSFQSDRLYWLHKFTKTRRNRKGVKFPKGFIELQF